MYKIISYPPLASPANAFRNVVPMRGEKATTWTGRSTTTGNLVRRAQSNGSTEIVVYGDTNPIATIHLIDDGKDVKKYKIDFTEATTSIEPEAPHYVTVSIQEGGWILGVNVRDQHSNTTKAFYTIYRNTSIRLPTHHVITTRHSSEIASAKGPAESPMYTLTVTDPQTDPRLVKCLMALADNIE